MMRGAILSVTLVLPVWIGLAMPARAQEPAFSGDQEPQWRSGHLSGSAAAVPIRLVGQEEPWERVGQDIQRASSPT